MKSSDDKHLPFPAKIASAGLAGCTADIFTFPFDTIKVWLMVRGEHSTKPPTPLPPRLPPEGDVSFSTTKIVSDTPQSVRNRANVTQKLRLSEHCLQHKTADLSTTRYSESAKPGAVHTIITKVQQKGFKSLYGGLTAGLQRQIAFCSVRIGFYDHIKKFFVDNLPASSQGSTIVQRIFAGATSGCLAVCLFQPTEVVKIRIQADRSRYRGCIDAYRTIFKTGGVRELWKGVDANCARLSIVNVCELVTYDMAKDALLTRKLMTDNVPCHFVSAFIAGLVTTVVANPVDVIKTRYMNSEKGTYKNPIQCAKQLAKHEGLTAFYKGFFPSYIRIGLWNLIMFLSFEQYKRFFAKISHPQSNEPRTF